MKQAPWIIALVFATSTIVLLCMKLCSHPALPPVNVITITDTVPGDSIPYSVLLPKPYPVFHDTGSWRYFPIDTMAILADHFSRNYYLDTLKNDTSALVVVIDTVSWNTLQGRGLIFQNRRATSIVTVTPPATTSGRALYLGASIGYRPEKVGFGPAIMYTDNSRHAYSLSFDIVNRDINLSMTWRIGKHPKIP